MRTRFIAAVLAALASVVLLGVGSASAAVNSTRYCDNGSVRITASINHDGYNHFNYLRWWTAPFTEVNRIAWYTADNASGANPYLIAAVGGTSGTLNDVEVANYGYQPSGWPTILENTGHYWRASVWGGAGDSTAVCNTGPWESLD